MATRVRAIVCTRWKNKGLNAAGQTMYDPELLDDAPTTAGVTVTDLVGQPDENIPPTPNIYIAEISGLTAAQATTLNGLNKYFVLMSETYDDVTGVVSSSTYDDIPTGAQLTAFANTIKSRFPDVDDDKLADAGQAIMRAGLTRRQILQRLITRWQRFQKG